jgi:hemerythrin-like metal-binding protein
MLIEGYTPYWLYRILPVIYGVSGVAVIVAIGNGWAIFSGLLLISAAAAIVYMRMHHWAEQKTLMAAEVEAAHPHRPAPAAPAAANRPRGMVPYVLSWDVAYESGHSIIDRQHRKLFESCNALIRAVEANGPRADVVPLLDRLVAEVEGHFRTEEALLSDKESSDALTERHREHEELKQQARHLVDEFRQDRLESDDVVGFLVSDLVALHVISEAKQLKAM